MVCNSCAKSFSLLRREKACPGCGFSYCSNCLSHKMFVPKLNSEAKVCSNCKKKAELSNKTDIIQPPKAFYEINSTGSTSNFNHTISTINKRETKIQQESHPTDQQIVERLHKLRAGATSQTETRNFEQDVVDRLKKLKGSQPDASIGEIEERLAKLRGVNVKKADDKTFVPKTDLRSDEEKTDDLIRQYMDEIKIDDSNKEAFDNIIKDIETRLNNLKADRGKVDAKALNVEDFSVPDSDEDEEEFARKIVEKYKAEAVLEEAELNADKNESTSELPWCEICNEDAVLRCLGCKYLFCKQCYREHKDDDPECSRYEPYKAPKTHT